MRLPKTNQKLSLRIPQGPWEGLYSTYVEGIDQSALVVAHPMYGGETVPLKPGDEVHVEFIDGGERLAFSSRVIRLYTQVVPLVALTLPAPGAISRHQLRNFVRLDANLPLQYRPVPAEPAADQPGEPGYRRGRTVDISGSGAQIVVHEAYPVGARLDLLLSLPDAEVSMEAEVVRLVQQRTPQEVWLGVRFTRLEDRDRERIIHFIFSEQRFRRKKGLL